MEISPFLLAPISAIKISLPLKLSEKTVLAMPIGVLYDSGVSTTEYFSESKVFKMFFTEVLP